MKPDPIPQDVALLCKRLRAAGHAAHPVGGAVRDLMLGRPPRDWDVTTSARPEEILTLFPDALLTGAIHGTITVSTGSREVEVTTFRRDGPYSDGRRPDWVEFVDDLNCDLARRDFTFNAMALDENGGLIDPFGGMEDIARRTIRCVGRPEERFDEDALRMLRAVRFSAQLDFELGDAERAVLTAHPDWAWRVSAERTRLELEDALVSPAPGRAGPLFSLGLLDRFLSAPCAPDLSPLVQLPSQAPLRWGGLCRLLLEKGGITDAALFLQGFHMDRRTRWAALSWLEHTQILGKL